MNSDLCADKTDFTVPEEDYPEEVRRAICAAAAGFALLKAMGASDQLCGALMGEAFRAALEIERVDTQLGQAQLPFMGKALGGEFIQ